MSVALAGIVLSGALLLDRTSVLGGDPFAPATTALVEHPLLVSGAFALVALVAHYFPVLRPSAQATS